MLGGLPKTRPQRSSPRRDAARLASAAAGAPDPEKAARPRAARPKPAAKPERVAKPKRRAAKPKPSTRSEPTANRKPTANGGQAPKMKPAAKAGPRAKARARAAQPEMPPVPRQGFESEGDRATGAVKPPGGTELASTAAEILGELAKAGLSTGERLLRDVFSRLPG